MTAAVVPLVPMNRTAAMVKAVELLGEGAVVGLGVVLKATTPVHYVGKRAGGRWLYLGFGDSWEEAFKTTRQLGFVLPDGSIVDVREEKKP